jgi:hypothetical protein
MIWTTSSLGDVSDIVLLSSLLAAMLAGFSHAVTRPSITKPRWLESRLV